MLDSAIPTPPDGARLALDLVGLRREIDRLELRFSQAAATFAKTTFWDDEGSNSALDWIRFNCRMTSNAAADRLTVGDRLANLGRSAQTMESGEIGFEWAGLFHAPFPKCNRGLLPLGCSAW